MGDIVHVLGATKIMATDVFFSFVSYLYIPLALFIYLFLLRLVNFLTRITTNNDYLNRVKQGAGNEMITWTCRRYKYNTPVIYTLLLCQVFFSAGHVSALPSTFRLCRAVFLLCQAFSSTCILSGFRLCQAVFSYAEPISALSTFFLLCWARLGSVKHFSAILSTFRLYQSSFFYIERFFRFAKHFSSILNIFLP